MPTLTTELKEISNPAAVGWEWTDTYHGPEYEGVEGTYAHCITWVRGTETLTYGTRAPGRKEWTSTRIINPERFGFDATLPGARAAARAFYNEGRSA